MSSHIRGVSELLSDLEQRFGEQETRRVSDRALKKAADIFVVELKEQLRTFSGQPGTTGATVDEVTLTEPYDFAGARTITVHWRGPKNRYRIIHLNEFGTVKNPNPRGKGAIARAMQVGERAYQEAIAEEIRRSML